MLGLKRAPAGIRQKHFPQYGDQAARPPLPGQPRSTGTSLREEQRLRDPQMHKEPRRPGPPEAFAGAARTCAGRGTPASAERTWPRTCARRPARELPGAPRPAPRRPPFPPRARGPHSPGAASSPWARRARVHPAPPARGSGRGQSAAVAAATQRGLPGSPGGAGKSRPPPTSLARHRGSRAGLRAPRLPRAPPHAAAPARS